MGMGRRWEISAASVPFGGSLPTCYIIIMGYLFVYLGNLDCLHALPGREKPVWNWG